MLVLMTTVVLIADSMNRYKWANNKVPGLATDIPLLAPEGAVGE